MQPGMVHDYLSLKGYIKSEKEENDLLFREMMSIKRENQNALQRIHIIT
jgi:hypothetical protein